MSRNKSRPNIPEAELAYRHRKRDASNELKKEVEALPIELVQRLISQLDASQIKQRRELSQPQVYGIAATIVREFRLQHHIPGEVAYIELKRSFAGLSLNDFSSLLSITGIPVTEDASQLSPVQILKMASTIISIYAIWGLPQVF